MRAVSVGYSKIENGECLNSVLSLIHVHIGYWHKILYRVELAEYSG